VLCRPPASMLPISCDELSASPRGGFQTKLYDGLHVRKGARGSP
jgi:hypothetical protein